MYIFIKWTYLFRNISIKIVFLLRRDPYAASPGPSQWVFFLRCLGSSCQCCKHDLILQPHQKSPPRLESTSEDTNNPHFRCRFISGTFFGLQLSPLLPQPLAAFSDSSSNLCWVWSSFFIPLLTRSRRTRSSQSQPRIDQFPSSPEAGTAWKSDPDQVFLLPLPHSSSSGSLRCSDPFYFPP